MRGKVCIVTGANTGIGLETARGLARAGATVVLACRDVAKGERARASIEASTGHDGVSVMPLDLGDKTSVAAFARSFRERHDRLDVLVDNAGVATVRRTRTKDGFETTFGVNHLGTARLTLALLDLLRAAAPARVVIVSSKMHRGTTMRWDDLQFERRSLVDLGAYKHSKLANILFAKALARRLAADGVAVNAVHPGVVATELTRDSAAPVHEARRALPADARPGRGVHAARRDGARARRGHGRVLRGVTASPRVPRGVRRGGAGAPVVDHRADARELTVAVSARTTRR